MYHSDYDTHVNDRATGGLVVGANIGDMQTRNFSRVASTVAGWGYRFDWARLVVLLRLGRAGSSFASTGGAGGGVASTGGAGCVASPGGSVSVVQLGRD